MQTWVGVELISSLALYTEINHWQLRLNVKSEMQKFSKHAAKHRTKDLSYNLRNFYLANYKILIK